MTLLWQDVNPRTGTRLDCPRPPDNKWAADVEVDYLDPQQMSPRFLPRRSRTDSTPGTVLRVSIVRLILQQLSCVRPWFLSFTLQSLHQLRHFRLCVCPSTYVTATLTEQMHEIDIGTLYENLH